MLSWHVLGAGSVGLLAAHSLRAAGAPVTLLVRILLADLLESTCPHP